MPRRPLIRTSEHPYHLRARSNNKDWFDLPLEKCFAIFLETLEQTRVKYSLQIHAFVMMTNHFHLLASTPNANIDSAMQFFMSYSSRRLRKGTGRINHIYGGRYRWSIISSAEYYRNCYRYVYQNPLRANLVREAEDWKYSTFSNVTPPLQLNLESPSFGHDCLLPRGKQNLSKWINELIDDANLEILKRGLSKPIFAYGTDRQTRMQIKKLL